MITLYTKPDCQQCVATKRHLDRRGIPYRMINLAEDAAALAHVQGLGFASAPVLEVGHSFAWAGYQPSKLDAIAPHAGTPCPVHSDTPVWPIYRGAPDPEKGPRITIARAGRLDWGHDGGPDDIVAFVRVEP